MSCNLNLQRDSKIFYSTVDIDSGAAVTAMTPSNTCEIEVLAGYAVSQSATTQDITTLESGLTPDRSVKRYNTAFNPAEWNFQCYLRPTNAEDGTDVSSTGNVKPVADWFMWQAALNNTAPASGTAERSAWQDTAKYTTALRAASANTSSHNPNFAVAQENHLYIKMDNVFYQIANAAINEASVDAAIDSIATTTWSGFGTDLIELTGVKRNNAVSVFGGVLNDGTSVSANGNVANLSNAASFHSWSSYNVAGSITTSRFIKNRLSTVELHHTPEGGADVSYTFPVTSLSWTINNNITYLTPEELNTLNVPIGNFAGSRTVTGSLSAYLRHGDNESARFLREIVNDSRVSHSSGANANLKVGGATGPYVAFYHPSVQYDFPTHAIEDVISIQVAFQAQEPEASCGNGGEFDIYVDHG